MIKDMNIILLGAPGAGKGTQGEILNNKLGIPTVSTGNILKAAIAEGTPMGLEARRYIDAGELVPDDVVIGIIRERLAQPDCAGGFILDGFPRTIPQAEALDKMNIRIDRVIEISVPDGAIVDRMSGRRICSKCGSSYHVVHKVPAVEGVCDVCGGELIQRSDDKPETVLERLRVYHEQTEPLKAYYAQRGIVRTVDGEKSIEQTSDLVMQALE